MADEAKKPTFDELVKEVAQAGEALKDATTRVALAEREETNARNRLNAAQKAFDAAVLELRKSAPRNTDWYDSHHKMGFPL